MTPSVPGRVSRICGPFRDATRFGTASWPIRYRSSSPLEASTCSQMDAAATGQAIAYVKAVKVSRGRYEATHAATKTGLWDAAA